jgi:hypothetical protein
MSLLKKPLTVNCHTCSRLIIVKYVTMKKGYSHKNNWAYWTEKEENQGQYCCNKCLLKLYKQNKWEFHQAITNPKLKQLFRKYVYDGSIK